MSITPRRAPGWVVALLWVVAMLNYLDRIMLASMRDSICEAIPMTDAQFGLLMSVFLWVYAVLSPLGGYLGDRFGRSPGDRRQSVGVVGGDLVDHDGPELCRAAELLMAPGP